MVGVSVRNQYGGCVSETIDMVGVSVRQSIWWVCR